MHIVSTLANHDYLNMERILGESVVDVFAYLQYVDAKVRAENAQTKYVSEMNKNKRK